VVLFLALALGIGYLGSRNDPTYAKPGDCLAGTSAQDLKTVDCTQPHGYVVVGVLQNQPESAMDNTFACAQFSSATNVYWQGPKNGNGVILCLAHTG
jgi:hypothetical protein